MNKKFDIDKLLNKPTTPIEKYHQKSKMYFFAADNLDPKKWPKDWKIIRYKGYGRLDEIKLPKPLTNIKSSFSSILVKRKSIREFVTKPMALSDLSTLLYYSAGINRTDRKNAIRRFYPSAGARFPLEAYIVAQNIKNLPKGLYHYYIKNYSLEQLLALKDRKILSSFNQSFIEKSAAILIITAVFNRNTAKYGDRGYRHILIEAGHLGQNVYLLSSALELGCCAIGGYIDDEINKLLDIDGINESVIYVLAIGTY